MYDIKWIREHPDVFDRGLKRRGLDPLSKKLVALDEKRRAAITKFEQAQARRNAASKEIGDAKKAKDEAKAGKLMAEVAELKTSLPAMEDEQKALAACARQGARANPEHAARRRAGRRRRERQRRASCVRQKTRLRIQAETALRSGRSARTNGFRARGQIVRRALRRLAEGFGAARARARPVHARCAHRQGAWIHGGESADPCSRRRHVWDGTATEVRR